MEMPKCDSKQLRSIKYTKDIFMKFFSAETSRDFRKKKLIT